MNVNGTLFKIYLNDTLETVKKRIVTKFYPSIQYKYIKFIPDEFPVVEKTTVKTENQIQLFLQNEGHFPVDLYKDLFENRNDVKREDVEKMFILYHSDVMANLKTKSPLEFMSLLLGQIQNLTSIDAFNVWKNRDKEKKIIDTEIDLLKQEVLAFENDAKEFERIQPIEISNFKQTQNDINFVFEPVYPITLETLFDKMKVNKNFPFIIMNHEQNFFKIFNNFQIPKEWLDIELDHAILLKINHFEDVNNINLKNFSNVTFAVEDDLIYMSISFPVGEKFISKDKLISEIFYNIPFIDPQNKNVKIIKEESSLITGYFYIPFLCNSFIWSELCMNNKFFYNIVTINEIIIPSRIKILFMYVLISRRIKTGMKIKFKQSINPLTNENYDTINMISKPPSKGIPECFTRFRIKCQNIEAVEKYKNIISRLFTIYENEKQNIAHQYIQYIPNFVFNDKSCTIDTNKSLKETVPDLFISSYSRKCLNPPKIIKDEHVPIYEAQGKFVMKYPLYGEGKQHNYICDIANFPHPGLRINSLVNKNIYPYIPCCYALDQVKKKNSKYNKYISGNRNASDVNIISNVKALPENIQRFFSLINRDSNNVFVLFNISEHRLSLLEAVMIALNLIDEDDLLIGGNILPSVLHEYGKICKLENTVAAKQELYDLDSEDILSLMQTELNPSLFIHVMEEFYNINIFMFSIKANEKGEMIVPRHASIYYKSNFNRRTILLLETMKFCDLIIQTDINNPTNIVTSFEYDNPLVQDLWRVFTRLSRSFNFDEIVKSYPIPKFIFKNIVSQWIDYFGKCRILILKNNITIIIEPSAPFIKPIMTNIERNKDYNSIVNFIQRYRIIISEQRVDKNNHVREIVCDADGYKFIILSDLSKTFDNVKITKEQNVIFNQIKMENNNINVFQKNKKTAYILSQHAIYMFSKYLHNNGLAQVGENFTNDEDVLFNFSKQIEIQPNHKYTISSNFSPPNSFVVNGKLVVTSEEMKKRIMYVIKQKFTSQRKTVLNYHTLKIVPNFYQEIMDFEQMYNGIIVKDKDNLKHVLQPTIKNITTKSLRPEYEYGRHYFFYNEKFLLDPNDDHTLMFLAINVEHLEQAIQLVKNWNTYGFINMNKIIQVDERDNVLIYSYVNEEDVKIIHNPQERHIEGAVLGYIFEDKKCWTAILPIQKDMQ